MDPTPALDQPTKLPAPTRKPDLRSTALNPPLKYILLFIEVSLRAEHTSAYGYFRQITPTLQAQAVAKGVRFEPAVTTAPWTCRAVAAVHAGLNSTSLGFPSGQ